MGTSSVGHVPPERLGDILHAARVLLANSPAKLGAAWEARLASVSTTERTREVRQRVGQELFREALLSLWNGRCAISGHRLPPRLLRASHAKPWAASDDVERLDPFNGLLLAVHYDALFDTGMISVADSGKLLVDPRLDQQTRRAFGLESGLVVAGLMPGHHHYLDYHRRHVAAWI
jgi:predicted restriction endonuclease